MICLLALIFTAQHLTTALEVDLSGDDWLVQSDLQHCTPQQLAEILKILKPRHREEVKRTKRIAVNGTVPGYVLSDLHREGLIADPLVKDHDVTFRPLARLTWEYSKVVELSERGGGQSGVIVFHGLDTAAVIVINKVHLFKSHYNQVSDRILILLLDLAFSFTFTFAFNFTFSQPTL